MKESQAMRLVRKLVAAFPQRKTSAETIEVYASLMADLDYAATSRACLALVAECDWMPTIRQIRERVVMLDHDPCDPGAGWAEVLRAVSSVGMYRTPTFDDPRITAGVASVGWKNICKSRIDNLHAYRAQFERAYKAAHDRVLAVGNSQKLLNSVASRPALPEGEDAGS